MSNGSHPLTLYNYWSIYGNHLSTGSGSVATMVLYEYPYYDTLYCTGGFARTSGAPSTSACFIRAAAPTSDRVWLPGGPARNTPTVLSCSAAVRLPIVPLRPSQAR